MEQMKRIGIVVVLAVVLLLPASALGTVQKMDAYGCVGYLENNPPNAPYNPDPANASTDVAITVQLSWACEDPDGDPLTFDVYFGDVSPPPLVENNQSAMSYDPGELAYSTLYYWMVVAWDNQSAWNASALWCFTTVENAAPWTPSLVGNPRWWCTESAYTLTLMTIDLEGDAIDYQVDWGDGHLEWFGPYPSGEMVQVTHQYYAPAIYDLKAQARDSVGMVSNWSEPLALEISVPELQKILMLIFTIEEDLRECGEYYWCRPEYGGYMRLTPPEILPFDPSLDWQLVFSQDWRFGLRISFPPYYMFVGFFDGYVLPP